MSKATDKDAASVEADNPKMAEAETYIPRFKKRYREVIRPELMSSLGIRTCFKCPGSKRSC
jgi:hypothetical protein